MVPSREFNLVLRNMSRSCVNLVKWITTTLSDRRHNIILTHSFKNINKMSLYSVHAQVDFSLLDSCDSCNIDSILSSIESNIRSNFSESVGARQVNLHRLELQHRSAAYRFLQSLKTPVEECDLESWCMDAPKKVLISMPLPVWYF